MNGDLSETRAALNDIRPENCDCSEINILANAYDRLVQAGDMTHDQAITGFEATIRPDCQGKVPREEVESELSCFADGCGVPEKICKHGKYLIAMSMKIRSDTAT
jgi:hypothetical protein